MLDDVETSMDAKLGIAGAAAIDVAMVVDELLLAVSMIVTETVFSGPGAGKSVIVWYIVFGGAGTVGVISGTPPSTSTTE